jgi:hypothetical protein
MHRKPELFTSRSILDVHVHLLRSRSFKLPSLYFYRIRSCRRAVPWHLASTSDGWRGYIFAILPLPLQLRQSCSGRDDAVRVGRPSHEIYRMLLASWRSRREPAGWPARWHPRHTSRWRERRHSHRRASAHVWWWERWHVGGHTLGHVWRREGRHTLGHVGSCEVVRTVMRLVDGLTCVLLGP